MRKIIPFLFVVVSLRAASVAPGQNAEVSSAIQVFDAWIQSTAAEREQPGLSIGIVYDQNLIWAKGYGFANLEKKIPATPQTAYRIASISKLFTSTAIMQLRDAGKLQLDDPVAKHLDWFRPKNRYPDAPPITIRNLITHTSGLPRESAGTYWNDMTFPTREAMMRALAEQETVLEPDTEWKYSNLALAIAGEVVAKVSGEPYEKYIESHILTPLGMSSTRVLPSKDMPNLATGYGRRVPGEKRDIEPFTESRGLTPAANLATTVEDLSCFVALQMRDHTETLGGAQILRGSTLREMHRVQWLRPDWKSGQGLGFAVRRVAEQVRIGHGGSVPGHRTQIEIAPEQKLGVIVLTNANDGDPLRYVNAAFTIVGPAIAKAAAESKPKPEPDPAWQKFVGTYTWRHSDEQVMLLNGELVLIVPNAENPWESRITLTPVGENTFRMKGGSSSGELCKFDVDASGRVTRMTTGGYYSLRK
jgi:CubicO group peptidase (beta-lactamase class C family)